MHLLQALRSVQDLSAVLVVTSDKVYANNGDGHPHVETDRLGGREPYSASKAATELACVAMAQSFLSPNGVAVATARAGNVIGGGDFAPDRLVPDTIRAALSGPCSDVASSRSHTAVAACARLHRRIFVLSGGIG